MAKADARSTAASPGKAKQFRLLSKPLERIHDAIVQAGLAILSAPGNATLTGDSRQESAVISDRLIEAAMHVLIAAVCNRSASLGSVATQRFDRWVWPRALRAAFRKALRSAVEIQTDDSGPRRMSVAELGSVYEQLLTSKMDVVGRTTSIPRHGRRKRMGSFYTPPELIDCLLNAALEPLLDAAVASEHPEQAILNLRVCDPASGSGVFLVAAAERIAARLAMVRAKRLKPTADELLRARSNVASRCLFGVDLDPIAVMLTRAALFQFVDSDGSASSWTSHIQCGNAIANSSEPESDQFHWPTAFPDPCDSSRRKPAGFDLVVGNPPFVNAIEHSGSRDDSVAARLAFPELGGTADKSAYFLARGCELVVPGGRVAFILPRALLNAPALRSFRKRLTGSGLQPNLLYVPNRCDFFAGAAVFVCGLVLGPESICLVGRCDDPLSNNWTFTAVTDSNWWQAAVHATEAGRVRCETGGARLEERFEVSASMTAGDAYDLLPALMDSKSGAGLRLLTTGLIEPGESLWGRQTCRYLKRDFQYPRVDLTKITTGSLKRRIVRSSRPKILVAGLAARIECLLDLSGDYIGAVSTYTILHPQDDTTALQSLVEYLLSKDATHRFRTELGGNALGGGNITMTKSFLLNLPLPKVFGTDSLAR